MQSAFVEHDALQCGFCTPGMIMSAYGLLEENSDPTRQQIVDHMEDNLCRCGAHNASQAVERQPERCGRGRGHETALRRNPRLSRHRPTVRGQPAAIFSRSSAAVSWSRCRPAICSPSRRHRRAAIGPSCRTTSTPSCGSARTVGSACFTGKIEMGQGVVTSLAQMLADELEVSLDSVDMTMGDTDLCPWDMGTFGSMTTRFFGPPLRAAAAEAREVLLELAAEKPRRASGKTQGD